MAMAFFAFVATLAALAASAETARPGGWDRDGDLVFGADYSKLEMPPTWDGEPLQVNVTLNLRNILEVNERSQYLTLESSLRMLWLESRVDVDIPAGQDFVSLHGEEIDYFWLPDLFVDQAKDLRAPSLQVKPATLRIYRGGKMRYSARINYDVACNMDFHRYPIDKQMCEIKYESFGYTSSQMRLSWSRAGCQVNPNITLDQFVPEVVFQSSYSTEYYDKAYPGVILRLYLQRKLNFHLVQTYVPSSLFVVLACLSLAISPDSVPGRVSMVMMTMLTLMAMFSAVRQSTPKVSYVSLLDLWMVGCLGLIFVVLLEFSAVTFLIGKDKRFLAEKLERLSSLVIPGMFALFNISYWCFLAL